MPSDEPVEMADLGRRAGKAIIVIVSGISGLESMFRAEFDRESVGRRRSSVRRMRNLPGIVSSPFGRRACASVREHSEKEGSWHTYHKVDLVGPSLEEFAIPSNGSSHRLQGSAKFERPYRGTGQ